GCGLGRRRGRRRLGRGVLGRRSGGGEGADAVGWGDGGGEVGGVGGEEGGWELDGGGDAVAGGVVEPDLDAVAGGEVAGHVVAQVLGGGDGEALQRREAAVGGGDVLGGHAEAGVDDGEGVAAVVVAAAPDVDGLVGG